MLDELAIVPLGSILPFKEGEVPPSWHQLDGSKLSWHQYPELTGTLYHAPQELRDFFSRMGGSIGKYHIHLPDVNHEQAAAWVRMPWVKDDLVLAMKVQRTLTTDDAGSTGEIHSDDSP